MHDQPQLPTNESPVLAHRLVQSLSRRYLLVLVSVAALVLIDQIILQPLLVQLNFYAPVINLAGRQRMLSQKATKEVLALVADHSDQTQAVQREELRSTLEQWTAAHHTLLEGNPRQGVQPVAPPIAAILRQVEPSFQAMRIAANEIAEPDARQTQSHASSAVATLLTQDPIYLRGMEQVVARLEQSAQVRVAWLRGIGLIAMLTVLALLAAVYSLVLRPAANLIRRQVELLSDARNRLEHRVAERTSELITANGALAQEMVERQEVESRMRDLSAELARASRVTALGQLATGLAHELNQPLATVANYAGTLELALNRVCPNDSETHRLVAQIKQAALRAGAIVRRMRNFVRGGSVQISPIDLNDLIREVVALCESEIHQGTIQLELDLTRQAFLVAADGIQLQQVLVNLIQNAIQSIKACPPSDRLLRISTAVTADEVSVNVVDTGLGFPAEGIEKCFDSFFSTKATGLGMGLAISRSIIQQHQGQLWGENRDTGGAVVGFSLPLMRAHDIGKEQQLDCVCD